jgi:hypothetical protein
MTRNMFDFTPRLRPSALPSSYSTPEAPPSPEMPSILRRISSSSWAIVFLGVTLGASGDLVAGVSGGGGESVWTARMVRFLMLGKALRRGRSFIVMMLRMVVV